KKVILPLTAIWLLSGCTTTQPQPTTVMVIQSTPQTKVELKCSTFPTGEVCATPKLSSVVEDIERVQHTTAHLDLVSNQNVPVGGFLNIEATSNTDGYLKLLIIDPDTRTYTVLPNAAHGGYLKAGERFYTNNEQFNFRATNPKGLHYVLAIFTQYRLPLALQKGSSTLYNANRSHGDLMRVLGQVKGQSY
ncbi:MAG TPA: DUF4384 domain-containing protein, partial [Epsilonproteobacteria bacterium]|nr:DUF4384 domain-containing protein [Campylobacterota bacterium]